MNKLISLLIFFAMTTISYAQETNDDLPFREIPSYPSTYTPQQVTIRMIQGLGYRYYWATEGLRPEDLTYQPSADARTTDSTLDHILGLSYAIRNTATQQAQRPDNISQMSWEEKRSQTLQNLAKACEAFGEMSQDEFQSSHVFFAEETRFPMWNLINGPLSDAIYHTGQLVSFRRSSGNPIHPGVRVFTGKTEN